MSNGQLASFIERVERLNAEKKETQTDIAEVFKEAKSAGYEPKIMRHIIRERAMDAADRQARDLLIETYMQALGMLADTPLGKAAVCIEEKIVRWPASRGKPYDAFCLETRSCTVAGHESDGWMRYGQADYLLYCFQQREGSLDCHLIDFLKLQEWFWPREREFPSFGPLDTLNRTEGRKVPVKLVQAHVPSWRRAIA